MKIKQVSVANCVKFFEKGFKDRWELDSYTNPNEPCFFLGVDGQHTLINSHRGPVIIYPISPVDCENLNLVNIRENIAVVDSQFLDKSLPFRTVKVEIELKDYSIFKPKPLGDKIYTYLGFDGNRGEFNLSLIKQIQQWIPYEIIYYTNESYLPLPIEELKEKYYDKVFLNLNFSHGNGFTTVRELGMMGVKTIMNTSFKLPSIISYSSVTHIVELINEEAKKIGTIQPSIDCHTVGDEWKNLDFWFKPKTNSPGKLIQMRNESNTGGLLDLINVLPSNMVMAEVGCYAGASTKMFMDSGKIEKLFAIDIWEDSMDIYKNINDEHSFRLVERTFDSTVAPYNVVKYKSTFDRVIDYLPELDFVYIDANHTYFYVKKDIKTALKKLKPNGIIGGHDYNNSSPDVIRCVNEIFGKPDIVFSDASWLVQLK
jgi:hypothetical protein